MADTTVYKVNKYGLTPCEIIEDFHIYKKGTTPSFAGFLPDAIPKLVLQGVIKPREDLIDDVADEVEVADIGGAAAKAAKTISATPASDVVIPDNWQDGHHLPRIALARQIREAQTGSPAKGSMTDDTAKLIISDEVARRNQASGAVVAMQVPTTINATDPNAGAAAGKQPDPPPLDA